MKLRLSFSIVILLISWSTPPDAWGLMPTRWQMVEESGDQTLPAPTENTAVIVFLLPKDAGDVVGGLAHGGLIGLLNRASVIYDVTSESPLLIGTIQRGNKFAYELQAGEYMFQSKNLLAVNVVAGKTYYIHVDDPGGMGYMSKLDPIRDGGEGKWQYSSELIQDILDKMVLIETHPKAQKYFGSSKWQKRIISKQKKNLLKKWGAKSDIERQKLTLNPEDGVYPENTLKQGNQITQAVEIESTTNNHVLGEQKDLPTSAVESPEPENPVSTSYANELKALEVLRDDGIFTEEEFQKQKAEILRREETQKEVVPVVGD